MLRPVTTAWRGMVEWKCWSVREQGKTLHWRCILTVVSAVNLGGFPGLPSNSHMCTHPPELCAFIPRFLHDTSVCPGLRVVIRTLLWQRWSQPQAAGAGSSARVAASCSDPTALNAGALSAEEVSTGFMLSQTLARSAFASILAIEGFTFFSQHCSLARGVCCIKSQCFPQWWQRSRGSRWSFALCCS